MSKLIAIAASKGGTGKTTAPLKRGLHMWKASLISCCSIARLSSGA
jgi:MinD superfamily P-loop ATPase